MAYIESGFNETELSALKDNKILPTLRYTLPSFNENELALNTYKIYFKSYASWSIKCSQRYSTSDVSNLVSEAMMTSVEYQLRIVVVALVYLGFQVVAIIIMFVFHKRVRDKKKL